MSSMQKARRHDPYPWTWEIPLLVFVMLILGLAVGIQVGRSLANLLVGAGWTWPVDQATFWRTIPSVAGGDAAAGLGATVATSTRGPGTALDSGLASPALVWTGIGIVEVPFLIAAGWTAVWGLRRWGPGRLKGMATRPEAEQMLGLTRLRKVSSIVRPDLCGKRPARSAEPAPAMHYAGSTGAPGAAIPGTSADREAAALGRGLSSRLLPERITGLSSRRERKS